MQARGIILQLTLGINLTLWSIKRKLQPQGICVANSPRLTFIRSYTPWCDNYPREHAFCFDRPWHFAVCLLPFQTPLLCTPTHLLPMHCTHQLYGSGSLLPLQACFFRLLYTCHPKVTCYPQACLPLDADKLCALLPRPVCRRVLSVLREQGPLVACCVPHRHRGHRQRPTTLIHGSAWVSLLSQL